ncbi:FecCD family ABC transporter permease [Alteribacter aurantiacus]|uniref:FecCD family ABC transporter permease n=1 Tax=Alteribacter aurantiacus TaxID=254410 RepID=UPI000401BAF7|nr:iron ABC transporter permease [Alteribacter aurantiacus]
MPNLFTQIVTDRYKTSIYLIFFLLLLSAVFTGVGVGSVGIPPVEVGKILLDQIPGVNMPSATEGTLENIIMEIRLPRVLLALFVGASLSVAGASFQGLLRNPLADPYTLGASSGAAVGAVMVFYFGLTIPFLGSFTLPVVAVIGGFVSLYLVLSMARLVSKAMSVETIILIGIIFSSFLGSLISLMIALSTEELRQIIHWLMGSVGMRGWPYVYLIVPFFIIGTALLLVHWRELNAFGFGEQSAHHLGVDIKRKKTVILFAAALLTGGAVAVSGTIGFIGLVIPHFVRLLIGPDHKHVLILSAIGGGAFLIFADVVARTIISPQELPIGVITALIGAPVFGLILIYKVKKQR